MLSFPNAMFQCLVGAFELLPRRIQHTKLWVIKATMFYLCFRWALALD